MFIPKGRKLVMGNLSTPWGVLNSVFIIHFFYFKSFILDPHFPILDPGFLGKPKIHYYLDNSNPNVISFSLSPIKSIFFNLDF